MCGCAHEGAIVVKDRRNQVSILSLAVLLCSVSVAYASETDELPENPTVAQQTAQGRKQIEKLRADDPLLDWNQEVRAYLSDIVAKLVSASGQAPPCPIEVHISSVARVNAEAMMGGQIVLFERMFDATDNESQLVSIVAHEIAHQLHGDFLVGRRLEKQGKYSYDERLKQEAAADADGARIMYAAGWDPEAMVEIFYRFHKLVLASRHGFGVMGYGDTIEGYYGGHLDDVRRPEAVEKVIATLPAEQGLIKDSPRFRELKEKY